MDTINDIRNELKKSINVVDVESFKIYLQIYLDIIRRNDNIIKTSINHHNIVMSVGNGICKTIYYGDTINLKKLLDIILMSYIDSNTIPSNVTIKNILLENNSSISSAITEELSSYLHLCDIYKSI
jgi:hypothetical protein